LCIFSIQIARIMIVFQKSKETGFFVKKLLVFEEI
jgi:hypothetical protein